MKVGLLTHHWVYNFGANLQCLATTKYLEELGHEVIVINYRPPKMLKKYQNMVSPEQVTVHEDFCKRYFHQTISCSQRDEVVGIAKQHDFDALICGSDAVLRLWIENAENREDVRFPNPFWLDWAEEVGVKKYGTLAASSMGTNYFLFPKSVKSGIRKVLSKMSHVSVRDCWTAVSLSLLSGGSYKVAWCPDPVFLLNDAAASLAEDLADVETSSDKYILLSIYENMVSDEWVNSFVSAAHRQGYKVYSLPFPEYEVNAPVDKILKLPMSPIEWYLWIKNASGYIGVRFHPIVCALSNKVPFVSFDNYAMQFGNRYLSYLSRKILRFSSKTYDLCFRAGFSKYCLNESQYRRIRPEHILELILTQNMSSQSTDKTLKKFNKIYKKTVNSIISASIL